MFKMALYMAFPVGSFYVFNRPELFFEKDVIELRKQHYRSYDPEREAAYRLKVEEARRRRQEREFAIEEKLYEEKLKAQAAQQTAQE